MKSKTFYNKYQAIVPAWAGQDLDNDQSVMNNLHWLHSHVIHKS